MRKLVRGLLVVMMVVVASFTLIGAGGEAAAKETILIWSWGVADPIEQGLIQKTWPIIEKEFDVKIEHEQFPGLSSVEFLTKVINAIRFGSGPDVIEAADTMLPELAYKGFLEEIPAWLDENLQEALLPAYQHMNYLWNPDGKKVPIIAALTRDSGGQVVFWNTEMYKEAGLDRAPLTWDEVFEFGKKLTKYDESGNITRSGFFFRTGGHVGGIADKFAPYYFSAGGEGFVKRDADGNLKANINNPIAHKTAQFYLDALYTHKIDQMGIPGDVGGWMKGQTATVGARRAWVPLNVQTNAPEMYPKLAAAPIPVPEEGMKSITTSHYYGLTINTKISDKKKELIWKIMQRLNEPDLIKLRTNDINSYLVYKATVDQPPFDSPLWKDYIEACANIRTRVESPKDEIIMVHVGEALNLILSQELSIEEGLAMAEEKINKELEGITFQE